MATGKRKIGGGQKYFGYKSSDVRVCMGELMCDQRLVPWQLYLTSVMCTTMQFWK